MVLTQRRDRSGFRLEVHDGRGVDGAAKVGDIGRYRDGRYPMMNHEAAVSGPILLLFWIAATCLGVISLIIAIC